MNEQMKGEPQQPTPPLAHSTSQLLPAGLPHSVDPMRVPTSAGSISLPRGLQAPQARCCLFRRQGLDLAAQLTASAACPGQSHSWPHLRNPKGMSLGVAENLWPWLLG